MKTDHQTCKYYKGRHGILYLRKNKIVRALTIRVRIEIILDFAEKTRQYML